MLQKSWSQNDVQLLMKDSVFWFFFKDKKVFPRCIANVQCCRPVIHWMPVHGHVQLLPWPARHKTEDRDHTTIVCPDHTSIGYLDDTIICLSGWSYLPSKMLAKASQEVILFRHGNVVSRKAPHQSWPTLTGLEPTQLGQSQGRAGSRLLSKARVQTAI